jgi:hypothetical protein
MSSFSLAKVLADLAKHPASRESRILGATTAAGTDLPGKP